MVKKKYRSYFASNSIDFIFSSSLGQYMASFGDEDREKPSLLCHFGLSFLFSEGCIAIQFGLLEQIKLKSFGPNVSHNSCASWNIMLPYVHIL